MPSLLLGDRELIDFEVPSDFPTGGTQAMAVHNFPGGTRTIQMYGAFPVTPVKWQGVLLGPDALDTNTELDRLRVIGETLTLEFGQVSWEGVIQSYHGDIKNESLINYTMEFMPQKDVGAAAGEPETDAPPESLLEQDDAVLADYVANPPVGVQIAESIKNTIQDMRDGIASALRDAGGLIRDISPVDLDGVNALVDVTLTELAPLASGAAGLLQMSTGLDLMSYTRGMRLLLNAPLQTAIVKTAINPNLFQLAATHLGSASRWQDIASLSGLTDPQPLGQFTVRIPPR